MPHRILTSLQIDEVSLVKNGADQDAHVVLWKSADNNPAPSAPSAAAPETEAPVPLRPPTTSTIDQLIAKRLADHPGEDRPTATAEVMKTAAGRAAYATMRGWGSAPVADITKNVESIIAKSLALFPDEPHRDHRVAKTIARELREQNPQLSEGDAYMRALKDERFRSVRRRATA